MIKVSMEENQRLGREEIAQMIDGWTVDVTLSIPYKFADGVGVFRGIYSHHTADSLSFKIFNQETGEMDSSVISMGFGWDLIKELKMIGPGMVCSQKKPKKKRRS